LLNCLRQPGLLCSEPPKSMRLNFKSAFQVSCHPDCFITSGTESVGLAADARGVMVFATPSRLFHRAPGLTILTRTWYHGTISSCTRTLQPSARTCKNHATATQTATHQTAGPLAQIILRINELATRRNLFNFYSNCIICYIIWTRPSLDSLLDSFMYHDSYLSP